MVWMQWFCKVGTSWKIIFKDQPKTSVKLKSSINGVSDATSGEHTGEMWSWSPGFRSPSCQDRSWLEHTVSLRFPQTLPDTIFTEIKEEENWKARIQKRENWVDTTTTKMHLSLDWITGGKWVIGVMQLLKTWLSDWSVLASMLHVRHEKSLELVVHWWEYICPVLESTP